MREKALKIVVLAVFSAFASGTHALAAKTHRTPAKAVAAKVKPTAHALKKPTVPASKSHVAKASHVAAKSPRNKALARFEARRKLAKPEPKVARHEAVSPPEPAAPEQAPIQVTHDRKHHLEPALEPSSQRRKAKPEDFVKSFAAEAKDGQKQAVPTAKTVEKAPEATVMPVLYTRRGKLIVPPAMKGSHDILLRQNEIADRDGLDRIQDDDDLLDMRESRMLVPIPAAAGIQTDERLPANRRYCRPWTAQFLTALARAHYARFHSSLQINSAVRTVEFQHKLLRTNGNAAPAEGETASPHLTGQAIDLAKHGLSLTEIAWLRGYLLPLVQAGKVDVEEEFQQACFHISVYRKYVPEAAPKREIATRHVATGGTLATVIR